MSVLHTAAVLLEDRRFYVLLSLVILATAGDARTGKSDWTGSAPEVVTGDITGPENEGLAPVMPTAGAGLTGRIGRTGPTTPVPEVGFTVPVTETKLATLPDDAEVTKPVAGAGKNLLNVEVGTYLPDGEDGPDLPAISLSDLEDGPSLPVAGTIPNMPAMQAGPYLPSGETGLSLPVEEARPNLPVVESGYSLPVTEAGARLPAAKAVPHLLASEAGAIPPAPVRNDPMGEEGDAVSGRYLSAKEEDSTSDGRPRKLQLPTEEDTGHDVILLDRTPPTTDTSPRRPGESSEQIYQQTKTAKDDLECSSSQCRHQKINSQSPRSAPSAASGRDAAVNPQKIRSLEDASVPRSPREAQMDSKRSGAVQGTPDRDTPHVSISEEDERDHMSDEHRLFEDLFRRYNNRIRPVHSHVEATEVFFQVSLFNLIALNIREEKMQVNTEVILRWNDYHLKWNPDNYNGTTVIRAPYNVIWYPDIVLYNTAGSEADSGTTNTNAIIRFDGEVELVSHSLFTSSCEIDIQWYPFDQQTCPLEFASWSYDVSTLRLKLGPADLSKYRKHPEYFLEDFFSSSDDVIYPCCHLPFSTVTYHVQLQRRTMFSVFFYIMPGVLINICALMVFSLPAECGEKMALGTNSMLAMIVFLMAMIGNLPPSERLPVAGVYYGVCLSVLTLNIVFSVFVLNVGLSGDRGHKVPPWVRRFVQLLNRFLWLHVGGSSSDVMWAASAQKVRPEYESGLDRPVTEVKVIRVGTVRDSISKTSTLPPPPPPPPEDDDPKSAFQYRILEALGAIRELLTESQTRAIIHEDRRTLTEEWRHIGRVLDRFLFVIFVFVSVLFNAIILSSSPYGTKYSFCPLGKDNCDGSEEPHSWPSVLP